LPNRIIFIFIGIFFLLFSPIAMGINADSLFSAANRYYDAKDYPSARDAYQRLEQYNYISAPLYFDIGNCYFKEGKLGYAILYYLRAQKLDPTDDDIKNNLAFVRQFLPTNLEGVKINPVASFLETIAAPFTLNGIAWISSLLFMALVLFLCVIIQFQLRGALIKMAGYALLALLVISSSLTTFKYRNGYVTQKGVIVAPEAHVYSGPGEDNDLEFVAAHGLTFEIEKSLDKYYLVIFENKRKGWINKDNVEVI